MNRKRILVIVLLILLIGAFIVVPLLKKDSGTDDFTQAAVIDTPGNLGVPFGSDATIPIMVNTDDVRTLELIYNDSIFKTWNAPKKGKLVFQLDADYYGLGARTILLRITRNDGRIEEDAQNLRVLSDTPPAFLKANSVNTFPHDQTRYTQGLEFSDGILYEGTGDPGQKGATLVGATDLASGNWLKAGGGDLKNGLDANYFGEGITIMGDKLYQLTWQSGKCFVYDKKTMKLEKDFNYTGEGWGLCNDGRYLIMSDGSEYIYFRDPKTFEIVRTIQVYDNADAYARLNELEYVDGKIYANVYTTNMVVVIDPNLGKVLEVIDATPLVAVGKLPAGEVLNGIAYNPATKKLYMTGKNWSKIMEVSISE